MQTESELEIYIHIPFCVKKCLYCDFLSFAYGEEIRSEYLRALINEIKTFKQTEAARELSIKAQTVTSVFFGGGTPTVIKKESLKEILDVLKGTFNISKDAEVSIECNPGTVDGDYLKSVRQYGFNRLSIGLQSAVDEELKRIGRIHTFAQFKDTYNSAVKAGFSNINVDLISALPGQRIVDVDATLERVLSLKPRPQHISSYSLILEEGTGFMEMYEKGLLHLPDEDSEREFHWRIADRLEKEGYRQYELSNMAIPGYECRHNIGYWQGKKYIGFGLGAASYTGRERFSNTRDMKEYISYFENKKDKQEDGELFIPEAFEGATLKDKPFSEKYTLTDGDLISEFLFLGLRMTEGISISEFRDRFGKELFEVFGKEIEKHISEKLLCRQGDRLMLTRKGQDLANYVFSDFIISE